MLKADSENAKKQIVVHSTAIGTNLHRIHTHAGNCYYDDGLVYNNRHHRHV